MNDEAPWWQRLPGRMLEEEAALLALHAGEVPLVRAHRWIRRPNGEPRVRVGLALASRKLELEVRFPAHYPEGCPSVRPVPYEILSSHQFLKSGVLCLELGPDNWHPHYTVADMISSAWRLVVQEIISVIEPIDIPSRHRKDLAERVRGGDGVLLRSAVFDARVAQAAASCSFTCVLGPTSGVRIFPVAFPTGSALGDVPPAVARETKLTGHFVLLKEDAPKTVPTEPEAFDKYIWEHAVPQAVHETPAVLLLRTAGGGARGFLRFNTSVTELVDVPFDPTQTARTPAGVRDELAKRRIAIVGLGSLGSRVALSLARAGARRFLLVDGDVLEGPNLCRFPATFAHVGSLKTSLVKELIRDSCSSEPDIETHGVNIATATNPVLHAQVLDGLGGADVLVDATGNPDAFGLLAMIASDRQRALVWGEVFGGGLGGLVAHAHPNQGPCPRCVRAGLLGSIQSWPPAPNRGPVEPYGENGDEPVVATDADVAAIGAMVSQRVIDLVRGEPPTSAASVVGFRRGWVFDSAPQIIPIFVRSDDWSCPRCWKAATDPSADLAEEAAALFTVEADAHDPPTA